MATPWDASERRRVSYLKSLRGVLAARVQALDGGTRAIPLPRWEGPGHETDLMNSDDTFSCRRSNHSPPTGQAQ